MSFSKEINLLNWNLFRNIHFSNFQPIKMLFQPVISKLSSLETSQVSYQLPECSKSSVMLLGVAFFAHPLTNMQIVHAAMESNKSTLVCKECSTWITIFQHRQKNNLISFSDCLFAMNFAYQQFLTIKIPKKEVTYTLP